jgi:hypothetical protein
MYGVLTKESLTRALETQYSAEEFLEVAQGLCGCVRATQKGEQTFLLRKGLAKELCDEMMPLGYLCEYYLKRWPGTKVQLKLGNQAFDANVSGTLENTDIPSYVEITCLEDGTVHKQREKLHLQGVIAEQYWESDMILHLSSLLHRVIKNKGEKTYPGGTLLLVFLKTDYQLHGLLDKIVEVVTNLKPELSQFKRMLVMSPRRIYGDFAP